MKTHLAFHGAAGTVTGSKYHLAIGEKEILVDCGLFQGSKRLRQLNWAPAKYSSSSLERVLLTHAHLDHSGSLPRLVRSGFQGPILATGPTVDLCAILLADAGRLQEEDARYANKKGTSRHRPALPLFTEEDAEKAHRLMKPVPLNEWVDLNDGVRARWQSAGHILGAASIEVRFPAADREMSVTFSGDIGRYDLGALHLVPEPRPASDVLVIESTYGNRTHPELDLEEQLARPLTETFERGGVVLIPAFAVGRSQLVTLLLRRLMTSGRLPEVPIHIDSPMAIRATKVYSRYLSDDHMNEEVFADGRQKLFPTNVHFHQSVQESKDLNRLPGPRIIIAGSGMIVGGRILHHLKTRLEHAKNLVCLVGYQAEGTRGRALFRGAETVRIHGRDIPIRARVTSLNGLSGHGDVDELLRWYRSNESVPAATFVTHGEPKAATAFAAALRKESNAWVHAPELGERFELTSMLKQT